MKVGKDSVVMGRVPAGSVVGDGSVVIGATDSQGNTIINSAMAVGRNAQAGPGSIAIGAGANAGGGVNLQAALHELAEVANRNYDQSVLLEITKVIGELSKPHPNKSIMSKAWDGIKAASSLNGAHTLLTKIGAALSPFF